MRLSESLILKAKSYKKMSIVINSNFRFYKKTLPILLSSINKKEHNIEIIIGGSPWEFKKEVIHDINHYFVNYDNTVFTSLIFVKEHPEIVNGAPYYLYIHDTTFLGPQFFNKITASLNSKIKKYASKDDFEKNAANFKLTSQGHSMDMGLYRSNYFYKKQHVDHLPEKNTDLSEESMKQQKKWAYDNEDVCLRQTESLQSETRIVTEIPSPYGTEVKRIQEYFPGLDFYKFKGNWHYESREINL